ncbi:substrate-binding periplasmic protein [Chitinilyticum piscinae]|uniref:Transporter substrate-binding domain-containing protein n=1 Tax=Chitinilyticum piscinae TaxID=2866724 RepID=A0A8J7FET3_9NEIS|nr:transporter substrate-binding domain-containing protein [Chitinilyticum piscinae]MBE9608088.1 transporter substrate-binding domain-containing protein [Chitinilyticum piscinae]
MSRLLALLPLLLSTTLLAGPGPDCPPAPVSAGLYEYGMLYHDGRGIDKDVIEELVRRSGCKLELKVLPRAQIWQELAAGELMLTGSALRTPERERFALFSSPYTLSKNYAILPRQIASQLRNSAQFLANPQWRWGVVQSYKHGEHYDDFLATLRARGRVVDVADSEALFQLLGSGKVQGVLAQPVTYGFYLNRLPAPTDFVARDWDPQDRGLNGHLVFSKKHFSEADLRGWDYLLREMRHDGTLERIYRRYLPQAEARRMVPRDD